MLQAQWEATLREGMKEDVKEYGTKAGSIIAFGALEREMKLEKRLQTVSEMESLQTVEIS